MKHQHIGKINVMRGWTRNNNVQNAAKRREEPCAKLACYQIAYHMGLLPFGDFILSNARLREHQLQLLTMDCAKREVTHNVKTHPGLKRACRIKGSASLALLKRFISLKELSKGYVDTIGFSVAH